MPDTAQNCADHTWDAQETMFRATGNEMGVDDLLVTVNLPFIIIPFFCSLDDECRAVAGVESMLM